MTKKAEILYHKDRIHDVFREELANTYLKTSAKTQAGLPDRKGLPGRFRMPRISIPWVVACVALVLTAVLFISKSNIDIKVRISSSLPFVDKERSSGSVEAAVGGIFFISGGEANRDLVRETFFTGDAKPLSRSANGELILANSRGQGWASFKIEFRKPMDFRRLDLRYSARGEKGAEKLVLLVIDSDNKSYKVASDVATNLTKEWHTYTINFRPVREMVDMARVAALKFEFGSMTAGNSAGSAIFMKDIYVTKRRGFLWL
jgi:hypothetical protein